jgi:ketosteroid isomerase-like protein
MSQRNVQIVRSWFDAYNRRDFDSLLEITDEECDFKSRFVALESGFRGHAGFPHAYFRTLDEAYEHFQVIPSDFVDAGAAVITIATADWRGKASGAEGRLPIFVAHWLRAGKVLRAETFTDHAEALEAVGLSK